MQSGHRNRDWAVGGDIPSHAQALLWQCVRALARGGTITGFSRILSCGYMPWLTDGLR